MNVIVYVYLQINSKRLNGGIPPNLIISPIKKGGKRIFTSDRRELSDILMDLVEAHPLYN